MKPNSMKLSVMIGCLAAVVAVPACAELSPQPVRADSRVRKVLFQKDDVVFVSGTPGTSTMIVFGDDERIATVAIGDSVSWQAVPDQSNRFLFIKPLERDAVTNMNVVTNKHIYNFSMRASAPSRAAAVFKLQFSYPEDVSDARLLDKAKSIAASFTLQKLKNHPEDANFNYGFKGSVVNKPEIMFDDRTKTYFRFAGDIPAIFLVMPDRSETLVNSRKEGEFLIVDKVAGQFTLRSDGEATCVFNLNAVVKPGTKDDLTPVQEPGTHLETIPMPVVRPAAAAGRTKIVMRLDASATGGSNGN